MAKINWSEWKVLFTELIFPAAGIFVGWKLLGHLPAVYEMTFFFFGAFWMSIVESWSLGISPLRRFWPGDPVANVPRSIIEDFIRTWWNKSKAEQVEDAFPETATAWRELLQDLCKKIGLPALE